MKTPKPTHIRDFVLGMRVPGEKNGAGTAAKTTRKPETEENSPKEEDIRCRQCMFAITRTTSRIQVDGAHCHTFANPHGIVFEIGCFKTAPGCGSVGQPTSEFSWFPPRSWQVALCGYCLTHLGWRFVSPESSVFFGLILDRLVQPDP